MVSIEIPLWLIDLTFLSPIAEEWHAVLGSLTQLWNLLLDLANIPRDLIVMGHLSIKNSQIAF